MGKIYKKMTANDSKSYLGYLNKLIDECNDTYHRSISRKAIDVDHSALTKEIQKNPKANKFKVGDRVRITKYKNIFSKVYSENWSKEIIVIDSVLKTNPWTCKIKNLKGEKIIGSFREKELLLSKL